MIQSTGKHVTLGDLIGCILKDSDRKDFINYIKKMSGLRFIDWQTHVCNYVIELKAQEIVYSNYVPYIDKSQITINFDNPAQYSKALFHQAGLEVK